ncbi:TetR/AcrR family transcriptional regulator [Flavobacterium branchiophilum]|uniref:TetR family transcriptional regulator n=1 Tax=Flavobacterium branchiophilum TaxID=55197 RepID=A0A2H3KL08_9FLAO|nr:TetR/AcrR family transcriptional regulator [Flavobacterium branchiophilum]PDS26125.1 TetR family transcriptional regulator [Flavobacterium branchiophilum]
MKDKIIKNATEMFLKLGFKSVTMDDIASQMCISKKTIYKYFCNKELLIEETTSTVHTEIHQKIADIVAQNHNAISENFEILKMFKEMFQSTDSSPAYQLKKHYPDIYENVINKEIDECKTLFRKNIEKGIQEGLYRAEIPIDAAVFFYYSLIFVINENISSEKEAKKLELAALEYHIRAIASAKGIEELEKHITQK